MQYDTDVRNEKLRAIVRAIGPAPTLEIRTGQPPKNCNAASTGTLLVSVSLPDDWMEDAANGMVKKRGTWEGKAIETGDAGHFRLFSRDGKCRMQGTVGTFGTDMLVDSVGCLAEQVFVVNSFGIADGNG